MKENEIKKKMSFDVPKYDVDAIVQTVEMAKKIDFGIETHRMTEMQSVLAQIKFVPFKAWLLKVIIAIFLNVGMLFEIKNGDDSLWLVISILVPLLCLGSTNEICNILQPNLKGLLMTVRYSIRKVVLIRLILYGIIDLFILLLSIVSAYFIGVHFEGTDLLYVIALYNIMCGGCIYILNHTKESNAIFACTTWGGSLTVMNLILKNAFSEATSGNGNIILLFVILLSIWKIVSETKIMLGGLRESEISSQQFI